MRILHIVDHSIPLHSGYAFRSRAIFLEQRARGWETFQLSGPKHALVAPANPPEETVDGLLFHRTPFPTGLASRLPLVNQWSVVASLEARLNELIPRIQPDILHAHSPALDGLAMLRAGRRFGIPTVYEIRGFWEDAAVSHGTSRENSLRYRLSRKLEERVFRKADGVVCICDGIRRDLIARGVEEERLTVVPNAVDIERFQPMQRRDNELESALNLKGRAVIGFIGSFYSYEGLLLLVEAFPAVLARQPNARLLLVGGGQEAERLKAASQRLGLEERIIFTGRIPNDQVSRYYSLMDILCYPRLPMRLTELVTPLKPLEAMALQKPLLASDVGGHRELIREGETGTLFHAGDAGDLAKRLLSLLANGDQRARQARAGRAFVEKERNWETCVARYAPLYERLRDRRTRPPTP